ncbi:hypothetical protein YC2023_065763 [Brassica napus]
MVVTEQDSDHNGSTLMERLLESLYTYAALFDCLENKIPRTSQDRIKVEKMQFGEEIKNIIACEGSERRERHEKLENRARGLIWLVSGMFLLAIMPCCRLGGCFKAMVLMGRVSWSSSYGLGARYKVIPCLKLRISLGEALKNKSPELSSKAAVDK